jgi:hypothetical protein
LLAHCVTTRDSPALKPVASSCTVAEDANPVDGVMVRCCPLGAADVEVGTAKVEVGAAEVEVEACFVLLEHETRINPAVRPSMAGKDRVRINRPLARVPSGW